MGSYQRSRDGTIATLSLGCNTMGICKPMLHRPISVQANLTKQLIPSSRN